MLGQEWSKLNGAGPNSGHIGGIQLRQPLGGTHIGPSAGVHLARDLPPVHGGAQQWGQRQRDALRVTRRQAASGKKDFLYKAMVLKV